VHPPKVKFLATPLCIFLTGVAYAPCAPCMSTPLTTRSDATPSGARQGRTPCTVPLHLPPFLLYTYMHRTAWYFALHIEEWTAICWDRLVLRFALNRGRRTVASPSLRLPVVYQFTQTAKSTEDVTALQPCSSLCQSSSYHIVKLAIGRRPSSAALARHTAIKIYNTNK